MLDWFKRSKTPGGFPEYSAVRKTPSRKLPQDLLEKERSEQYLARREEIDSSLRDLSVRPKEDSSLFVGILDEAEGGVLTISLPDEDGMCFPVFSSPLRAADYLRSQSLSNQSLRYLSSSPLDLVRLLSDLIDNGIRWFALDRCPRCEIFNVTGSASINTADKAIDCWCISKATEFTRLDLYLSYAKWSATSGQIKTARDVALETVAHVSMEDPRPHFLLGQTAVALRDRKLLRESQAFLRFLHFEAWEQKLNEVVKSGTTEFEWEPSGIN